MGATIATLAPVLKEIYDGDLNDQLNNKTAAWNRIKQTSKGTDRAGGKFVNFPIHISRNSGIGSRNEGEALPQAGNQGTAEAQLNLRNHYAAVELTGQAIELVDSDYQSFISGQKMEMSKVRDDISKERNRQFFGDGLGTRTVSTAGPTGQVIPVADAYQLDLNGIYDVHVGATSTKRQAALKVTAQDFTPGANKVTVTGTVTGIVANDIWVRAGSYDREIHGIGAILSDTTTLYGIDPAVVQVWKANMKVHGSATAISELMLLRMTAQINRAGGDTTVIWTTPQIQRAYFALLQTTRRFVNTKEFTGGYSGLAYQTPGGEIPFLDDWDAPQGNIAFLNEKEIKRYSKHDGFKIMDRGGSTWTQKRDANGDYDVWIARLYEYSEMGTFRRNTHGLITNVLGDND